MNAAMTERSQDSGTGVEPTPQFASEADIELAARLRHQIEERYIERSPAPSRPKNGPDKDR